MIISGHEDLRNFPKSKKLNLVTKLGIIHLPLRAKSEKRGTLQWSECFWKQCKRQAWNTKQTMTEFVGVINKRRGAWLTQTHKPKWVEPAEEKHKGRQAQGEPRQVRWVYSHIKSFLLAKGNPFLTDNQKLSSNNVKTYLLENDSRFLAPAVKKNTVVQVWNCAFPDKSWVV